MDPVVFQLGFIGLSRLAMVRNRLVVEARSPLVLRLPSWIWICDFDVALSSQWLFLSRFFAV